MYLFDTNAFELLIAGDENTLRRVEQNQELIWLSSIAVEERISGYMNSINRARTPRTSLSLAQAHQDFVQALEDLRLLPILAYSAEAERIFQSLPAAAKRKGTQDCRIAAQALAHNMTVITRNLRDFEATGPPAKTGPPQPLTPDHRWTAPNQPDTERRANLVQQALACSFQAADLSAVDTRTADATET